jgi:hypothetical protein
MRAQARREYETKYTAERNYAQLIDIYDSVRQHADDGCALATTS